MKQSSLKEQGQWIPHLSSVPVTFQERQERLAQDWQTQEVKRIERVKYDAWALFDETIANLSAKDMTSDYRQYATLTEDDAITARAVHAGNHTRVEDYNQMRDKGIIVMDLFEAMKQYPDLVFDNLFTAIPDDQDKVSRYHVSHLNGGIFIYVPKDVQVTLPIENVLLQDSRYKQAFNKHVLMVCDTNSQVNYLERLESIGDQTNSATVFVEVIAKEGANVKYIAVDALTEQTTAMIKRYGVTEKHARLNWSIAAMNSGSTILDSYTYLKGEGSESQVNIICIATGKQEQAINTQITNKGWHSVGHIFQHGVILDEARLTFNGIGHILKNAKQADAQQESRCMVLSDHARGDANPILFIDEFEVTAGHAASIGQLEEEQLYYLMSRGLNKDEAEYLLIRGFLGQVIMTMPTKQVREQMVAIIDNKLAQLRHH